MSGPASSFAPERFQLAQELGEGPCGTVWLGVDPSTGEEAAIKDIELHKTVEVDRLRSEIDRLAALSSPNLAPYLGAAPVLGAPTRLRIAAPIADASAADLIDPSRGQGPLPEPCIAFIAREVLNALVYLHSEDLPARRLCPSNIFLSSSGEVRLGDFGCAALSWNRASAHLYAAPEVAQRVLEAGSGDAAGAAAAAAQGEAADVWALGITVIALAKGRAPHAGEDPDKALLAVAREPPPALEGSEASPAFKDFAWQCLRKAPRDRPAAIDLLMHPWVLTAELPPELPARVDAIAEGRRRRAGALLREGPEEIGEHAEEVEEAFGEETFGNGRQQQEEEEKEEEAAAAAAAATAPGPDLYGTTVVHPPSSVQPIEDSLGSLSFGYMAGTRERDRNASAMGAAASPAPPTKEQGSHDFGTTVIRRVPPPPPVGTGTVIGPGPFGGADFPGGVGAGALPPPPPRAPRPPRHSNHAGPRPKEAVAAALEGMAAELDDPGVPGIGELQAVLGARAAELRGSGGAAAVDMGCLGNYLVSQWSS